MCTENEKMISQLFSLRDKFVIIGLTGRTGSGCTTAASILEDKDANFPSPNDVNYKGKCFFSEMDSARYNLLVKYAKQTHSKFYNIKVSDLISIYLFKLTLDQIRHFIVDAVEDEAQLDEKLFNKINNEISSTSVYSTIFEALINHDTDIGEQKIDGKEFCAFLQRMKEVTGRFKEHLDDNGCNLFIKIYQKAGNEIRRNGSLCPSGQDGNAAGIYHLPETINRLIKILRKLNGKDKTLVVIDAIRNPYEVRYFRERYSAFYLFSINAPDEDRNNYLFKHRNLTVKDIVKLDKKESGEAPPDEGGVASNAQENEFVRQNVKACIELSDVHIFNPRNEPENHNILKAQLAWYLALIFHPGLVSPTAMERIMQIAYVAKLNSGCISRHVGAVITDQDNSIKSVGWNDVPKGQTPCNLRSLEGLINTFDDKVYSEYERTNERFRNVARKAFNRLSNNDDFRGRNLSYCFKDIYNSIDRESICERIKNDFHESDACEHICKSVGSIKGNQVHTRSLHAEENAFLQLTKYGGAPINGGKLYVTASPCELCSKKAYQLGIKDIVFIDPYPGIAKEHILGVGCNKPNLIQFRGAVGRGYHQLYEPYIPYKDELEYLMQEDDCSSDRKYK